MHLNAQGLAKFRCCADEAGCLGASGRRGGLRVARRAVVGRQQPLPRDASRSDPFPLPHHFSLRSSPRRIGHQAATRQFAICHVGAFRECLEPTTPVSWSTRAPAPALRTSACARFSDAVPDPRARSLPAALRVATSTASAAGPAT